MTAASDRGDDPQPLLDALPDEIALLDGAGHIVAVNRAWAQARAEAPLFGSAAGVGADLLKDCDLAADHGCQEARMFARAVRDLLARTKALHSQDIAGAGGPERRERSVRASRVEGSGAARILVAVSDITERRRLEEQFHQAQKMDAVGRLAGGVAHDFNNLLTAITGYSQLLLATLPENDPSRQDIEEIKKAGDRAAALVGQLLAFSRRQVKQAKVVDLNSIVRDLEAMMRRLISEDVQLTTHLAENLGAVLADPGQLEQVVVNLVVNARDAMPKGGRLTLSTANVELDAATARRRYKAVPGPYVVVSITDNGTGMTPETLSHLFEPFFTTKERGKGTGLGLSTVYGIVTQYGGHIDVESAVGRGSTFRVYLPRVERPLTEDTPPRPPISPLHGSETILLVEDDESVRGLVLRVLRGAGYTVLDSTKGDEALALCRNHPGTIHMLITDVVMPGMSGVDLAQQLTALRPDMKVLYVSGHSESGVRRRGVSDPNSQVLQKPFKPTVLTERVRKLLHPSP